MATLRIRILASNWAADFLAPVLLTLLESVADALALKVINFIDLLLSHVFETLLQWIIYFVARELLFTLIANTAFVHQFFAEITITIVTLLLTLVSSTGQKSLALFITNGNRLNAALAWTTK